jgi:hypothetical protein
MPFELVGQEGELAVVRIWGRLGYGEWERGQEAMRPGIGSGAVTRVLVLANGFEGWERTERWGELDFFNTNDEHLARIAVVGDPVWRDEMLSFTLQGMRKAAVEFFPEEPAARAWLSEG